MSPEQTPNSAQSWTSLILVGIALIGVGALYLDSPTHSIFDESYHLDHVKNVLAGDLTGGVLATRSAVGPAYGWFHAAFAPWTELNARTLRLANFGVIAAAVGMMCFWLRQLIPSRVSIQETVGATVAFPMLYPVTGMALTESLQLFFLTTGLCCLAKATTRRSASSFTPYLFLFSASWALMILSRQTSLVLLPLALLLPTILGLKAKHVILALALIGLACGWTFVWWRGLTPPGFTGTHGGFFRTEKLLLAFMYLLLADGVINARLLLPRSNSIRALTFAVFLAVVSMLGPIQLPASERLPLPLQDISWVWTILLVGMVAIWWGGLAERFARQSTEIRWDRISILGLILVAAAAASTSTFFTSRYLVSALPFLIYLSAEPATDAPSPLRHITRLVGTAVGLWSLAGYYGAHATSRVD